MKLRHLILLALGASISSAQVVGPPVEASVAQTAAGTQGAPYYISPRRLAGSPYALPTQTGNAGKFLTTDGTTASWASVTVPTAANPTGTISSTVGSFTNGVATTFMRSDAAPTLPSTISGLNSITSAALSNLTLATTSSGITSVTFASATGIPTFATAILAPVGTAAAPSYSFTGHTGDGWYYANSLPSLAQGGVGALQFAGGNTPYIQGFSSGGYSASGTINWNGNGNGSLELTAGAGNRSITLTPSGTGQAVVSFNDNTAGDNNLLKINQAGTGETGLYINRSAGSTIAALIYAPQGSNQLRIFNSSDVAAFTNNGNFLLGGTTNGTGQLQLLSTSGTSAGGITFATDQNLFRVSATENDFQFANNAGAPQFNLVNLQAAAAGVGTTLGFVGVGSVYIGSIATTWSSATNGQMVFSTRNAGTNTAALTLDSSQNATFAGNVTLTAGDLLPGTDNNHNIGSASKRWSSLYVGSGTASFATTISTYNNIATAGNGVATIQGAGRATAQTAANSSIATYTVGAADASFIISANVLVTTATAHSFSIECAYTDEGSTARTVTFNVQQLGGTLVTAITNVTGAGPYEGVPLHIRAKASTSITIRTNAGGTYTTVTYNAEGVIQKLQ